MYLSSTVSERTIPAAGASEFSIESAYSYNIAGPVRWIVSHVQRYPVLPIILVVTAVVNNYAYSYIQVFIGRAFDLITTPGFTNAALLATALGVVVSATTQGVTGIARNFSVEFMAQRIERDCRDELYASLLGKSQTFHGRQRIGDIMARATNDVRSINMMFSPGVMLIVDAAMAVVMPIIVIATISTRLLAVPLAFVVLLTVTVWDYNRRLKPVSIAQRATFGAMNASLTEAVSGVEVVKANAREPYEKQRFFETAREFCSVFVKQGKIQAKYYPMLAFAFTWGAGLVHALIVWRAGEISLGTVVAFMGLLGTLRFPTFISIFSFNLVQLGVAGAERILELIKTETELDENTNGYSGTIRGHVEFENVSFGFDGKPVIRDVSFVVEPGRTVAIVGRTGTGKTTLTRLVNRIFDVESGAVKIDGIDVRDWTIESLRSQVSTIEQDVFLFSKTLRENIAFGVENATDAMVEEAARAAQADDFIRSFPNGYDTVVGERGVTLSGGQRQRIAIARAFLTNPRILVLDDSTSAIDSATEDKIQRAMKSISRDRTTFLITHRLSQIRWADHIIVLDRGRVIDHGSHDDLIARSEAYTRIFARFS